MSGDAADSELERAVAANASMAALARDAAASCRMRVSDEGRAVLDLSNASKEALGPGWSITAHFMMEAPLGLASGGASLSTGLGEVGEVGGASSQRVAASTPSLASVGRRPL